MKKLFLALVLVLLMAVPAFGMGPKIIAPHTLAWDAPTGGGTPTGYYIYWRVQATPANPWLDINRNAVTVPTQTKDLSTLSLANGSYEFAVTAYNLSGESGPSNIVPFVLNLPGSPGGNRIEAP